MGSKRRLAGLAGTAAALLMAAGCGAAGGSGSPGGAPATPSAATLAQKMRTAMGTAKSVHVSGEVIQGGKATGVDLSMTRAGQMSGTLTHDAATVTILSTNGKTYLKSAPALLKSMHLPASACAILCHKYLEMSPADARGFTGSLNWSGFVASGLLASTTLQHIKVVRLVTVDGQSAWLVRSPDGSTGYVAAHGPAFLLRIAPPRGQGSGRMDLTQWNSVTIPPPPPASKIVTPSQLGG